MRLLWVTLPLSLAIAAAGLYLVALANRPHVYEGGTIIDEPRHYVTPEMIALANGKKAKMAPDMTVADTQKHSIAFASRDGLHPQFVYFIMDGCPCSYEAEPLYHELAKRYAGKVDFVGVTDGNQAKAARWVSEQTPPYPIVPDPNLRIIHAYQATNSTFSLLITPKGQIVKMWPGYSAKQFKDINRLMSDAAGIKETPFDTKWLPTKEASGCAFPEP